LIIRDYTHHPRILLPFRRLQHPKINYYGKFIPNLTTLLNQPCEGCKNKSKNGDCSRYFLVEGWSIEGCITKVIEWIVMNVGLLILHKTKVLIF